MPPGNRPGGPGSGGQTRVSPPTAASDAGKKASKDPDFTVNKVVAGAGAAIVTAVLGSFLGAIGTVLGAALGSIITTVATTFFQRSMEHTRAQVADKTQRIRDRAATRSETRAPGSAAWQAAAAQGGVGRAGPGSQETVRIDPSTAGRVGAAGAAGAAAPSGSGRRFRMSRRSIVFSLVAAGLAFVVAMFLVTGIELIKGSTITGGGSGTSIGNVANGTETGRQQTNDQNTNGTSTSESATPTGSSSSTSDPSQTSGDDNGSTSSPSSSNPLGGLNKLLPSRENGQLQSGQSGQSGSNSTGGGANSSN